MAAQTEQAWLTHRAGCAQCATRRTIKNRCYEGGRLHEDLEQANAELAIQQGLDQAALF